MKAALLSNKSGHGTISSNARIEAEVLQERLASNGAATASSTRQKVVIGIDPDNHGAVAVIRIPEACSGVLEHLSQVDVEIHDMPLEEISVGKRIRRWAHAVREFHSLTALILISQLY